MELQRRAFPFKEVSRVQRILGTPLEYICVSLKGKVTQYWIICTCPRRCLLLDPLRHSWPALAMLFLLYLICFIWKCSGQCCHLYCWRSYRELLISICAVFHWQNHIGNSGNLPKWYIISQSKTRENSSKELVNLKINEQRVSIKEFQLNAVVAKLSIILHYLLISLLFGWWFLFLSLVPL